MLKGHSVIMAYNLLLFYCPKEKHYVLDIV